MDLQFLTPASPCDEAEILAIEAALGFSLPRAYRRFLEVRGGGRPVANQSTAPEAAAIGVGVTRFFGPADLVRLQREWSDRVPDQMLAIADAEGGNLVCVAVNGDEVGAVFFWDHEGECEEGAAPDGSNVTRIATGFSEFVDDLLPIGVSGTAQPVEVESAWIDAEFLSSLQTKPAEPPGSLPSAEPGA